MRSKFFGSSASTSWNIDRLKEKIIEYHHYSIDIRNDKDVNGVHQGTEVVQCESMGSPLEVNNTL
jgi:hypothetical protein